jgi:hypothetical protein
VTYQGRPGRSGTGPLRSVPARRTRHPSPDTRAGPSANREYRLQRAPCDRWPVRASGSGWCRGVPVRPSLGAAGGRRLGDHGPAQAARRRRRRAADRAAGAPSPPRPASRPPAGWRTARSTS